MNQNGGPETWTRAGLYCLVFFGHSGGMAVSSGPDALRRRSALGRKSLQRKEPRNGRPKSIALFSCCGRALGARSASGMRLISLETSPATSAARIAPNATIYSNPANPYTAASQIAPGIFLKDVALDYNSANDTLYVGVQTYGVTGSVSGTSIATGNGLAVGFAPMNGSTLNTSNLPTFSFVAGDSNYSVGQSPQSEGRGTGLDGFNVAKYSGSMAPGAINLLTGFGTTLSAGMGNLAFAPERVDPRLRIRGYEFQ